MQKRIAGLLVVIMFATIDLAAQSGNAEKLISEGGAFHDQGKYNEAIAKYREALTIDSKSSLASYELSYSALLGKQYDTAIKYSQLALEINTGNQHESYIILGSALDILGKPREAIKVYEKGLSQFANSNLLHYNLALTCYNQQDYKKAEQAAINAILVKPSHGSSHIILAATMIETGQRIKAVLPLYYSLMLDPSSRRSADSYRSLNEQLREGVEKKDDKNININVSVSKDDDFGGAELMLGLLAASKYTEKNQGKNEMEMFAETTRSLFVMLGEMKDKKKKGLWWDFYVAKFNDLVESKNDEAFAYYISQSANNELVKKWIDANPGKMQQLKEWIKNKAVTQ